MKHLTNCADKCTVLTVVLHYGTLAGKAVTVGKRCTVYKVNDQPSCILLTVAAGGYLLLNNGKFSDDCGQERRKKRRVRT
jgi:hypothetical protein